MDEWHGLMNWPIDPDWKCEICGQQLLIWGWQHAHCRCDRCHMEYQMRNRDGQRVTVPIICCKPEWIEPMRQGWQIWLRPWTRWSQAEYNSVAELVAKSNPPILSEDN